MSAGKGDKPRPINKEKFDENYEAIFGPRNKKKKSKKEKNRKIFKKTY